MTKAEAEKEIRSIKESYSLLNQGGYLAAEAGLAGEFWESTGDKISHWLVVRD
jgi:hypothetical protein